MTSLGGKVVERTRYNWVRMDVSGDLSCVYSVVPKGDWSSIGLGFPTKTMAIKFARKTGKYGWRKQCAIYEKYYTWEKRRNWRYGYIPEKYAREYAPYGYDEYAERMRKKYKLKKR